MDDWISAALAHIHRDEVVNLARQLVAIPSVNPPGDEREVALALGSVFEREGIVPTYQWVTPERPNLIVVVGRDGRHLTLNGHTDVVGIGDRGNWSVDPFVGDVRDDRLIGRGAVDMKGGVASMAMAIVALHRAQVPLNGRVSLTAVMGEETGNEGTRHLLQRGFKPDAAIVGEATSADSIAIGYRGALWIEIATKGRTAHGGRPHHGTSAILHMVNVVMPLIKRVVDDLTGRDEEFIVPTATLNVGTISGGMKVNVVPDQCTATFDIRLMPGQSTEAVLSRIETALRKAKSVEPNLDASVTVNHAVEAFKSNRTGRLVDALDSSIATLTGSRPKYFGGSAFCDANVFVHELQIPAVVFGPGPIGSAHAPDEWVALDDLEQAARTYVATAIEYCGVDGEN